jgi:16S rRNA C967 or C1407 C5-methylase (RsmB/RsmF family)
MYIQEVAAASSAPLLEVQDGDIVLDMASAP